MTQGPNVVDIKPKPKLYVERIGEREWEINEVRLDVNKDVALWSDNPRLQMGVMNGVASQEELEAQLQMTPSYDALRKSIFDLGQMEPIYVWRLDETSRYITLEGASRVTILRELNRKHTTGIKAGKFQYVTAKILPPGFGERERVILLARIHVRGSGVRAWGRYIESKFIYDAIESQNGRPALMNATEMANYMAKSLSWVTRLRDAYKFACKFIEHVDDGGAERLAIEQFSTLEEVSKAAVIGSHLRDYEDSKYDTLRSDVFDMVKNEVFQQYRDARFLKDFYDDLEKWNQLKTGEKHIASKLALELKTSAGSLKTKISGVEQQVQRAIERKEVEFDEDDIDALQRSIMRIHKQIHPGVRPFRVALKGIVISLSEASMADVKALTLEEISELGEAVDYFQGLVVKHRKHA